MNDVDVVNNMEMKPESQLKEIFSRLRSKNLYLRESQYSIIPYTTCERVEPDGGKLLFKSSIYLNPIMKVINLKTRELQIVPKYFADTPDKSVYEQNNILKFKDARKYIESLGGVGASNSLKSKYPISAMSMLEGDNLEEKRKPWEHLVNAKTACKYEEFHLEMVKRAICKCDCILGIDSIFLYLEKDCKRCMYSLYIYIYIINR